MDYLYQEQRLIILPQEMTGDPMGWTTYNFYVPDAMLVNQQAKGEIDKQPKT